MRKQVSDDQMIGHKKAKKEETEMFEGFEQQRIDVNGVGLNVRVGGQGPAVVLLHGYPQTHIMWRLIAPALTDTHTVVVFDTRGYGDSDCPPSDPDHIVYSKRTMAADVAALMTHLGFEKFAILSHDRGARVGYRTVLDYPDRVTRYISLDVVPTHDMWLGTDKDRAMGGFHWTFLAQPAPQPERMIGHDSDLWLETLLTAWAAEGFEFDPDALDAYKRAYRNPDVIRGTCEDYRAGATCDDAHDLADKESGRKIQCPVMCLWGGARGKGGPKSESPLDIWRAWCSNQVTGQAIAESGHFLPEEAPEIVLSHVKPFLSADA